MNCHKAPYSVVSQVSPAVRRRRRRGFTLMETALATVIVGLGVVGMMQLLAVCTAQNRGGAQSTTAMYLAQCVQEMTSDLPFNDPSGAGFGREEGGGLLAWNDVDDFHGYDSRPGAPVNAMREPMPELAQYGQLVTVTEVNPNNLTVAVPGAECKRILVQIFYRANTTDTWNEVYRTSWVRTR